MNAAAAGGADTARPGARNAYAAFRVLLDSPADSPGLGYDGYADALTEVIMSSRAEFAVGILGRWGSGKTTLMRAIQRKLDTDNNVVTVWFAAWRYEREPNLILPLLDVLREALENRAKAADGRGWAHDAAVAVTRAGLAFLAGLKLKAGLPGGVGIDLDLGKTIEEIRTGHDKPEPLSFYHAGYRMLTDAIEQLSAGDRRRRVVIFIDDLDRCLPDNALDVLESMKLFFDVEGCVFVVGLDNTIAEKAVAVKYRAIASVAGEEATADPGISSSDYVKKLFQVPFALPPVTADQLSGCLDAIERNGGFGQAQLRDFKNHVRPHFAQLQGTDPVNLREVKRLINLYTTQLKILSRRLSGSLDPNVVLALLCMNFRPVWKPFYQQLAADPLYFQAELRDVVEGAGQRSLSLAGKKYALPADLADYLKRRAAALLQVDNLEEYVMAAESTWTTDPWVLEARMELNRLRRAGDKLAADDVPPPEAVPVVEAVGAIRGHVEHLHNLIRARGESSGPLATLREELDAALTGLMAVTAELQLLARQSTAADGTTPASLWESAIPYVDALDEGLLDWHQRISLGP